MFSIALKLGSSSLFPRKKSRDFLAALSNFHYCIKNHHHRQSPPATTLEPDFSPERAKLLLFSSVGTSRTKKFLTIGNFTKALIETKGEKIYEEAPPLEVVQVEPGTSETRREKSAEIESRQRETRKNKSMKGFAKRGRGRGRKIQRENVGW